MPIPLTPAPDSPVFSLMDAVCRVAQLPTEAPPDPCTGAVIELPQHFTSCWLLTFLPAMRALIDRDNPVAPDSWVTLEPRLGLRTTRSLWAPDLERTWRERVEAMRGFCMATGTSAAEWVTRWAPYEAAALSYVDACEHRRDALLDGVAALREMLMCTNASMFGCDAATGAFAEIPRAILYDPQAVWVTDAVAERYDNAIVFTGVVRTPNSTYSDIVFARADIDLLIAGAQLASAPKRAPAERSLVAATRATALQVYPNGPPAGTSSKARNQLIEARVHAQCGRRPSERTIRTAISGLWAPGKSRRRT